jgi:hypothetical protein
MTWNHDYIFGVICRDSFFVTIEFRFAGSTEIISVLFSGNMKGLISEAVDPWPSPQMSRIRHQSETTLVKRNTSLLAERLGLALMQFPMSQNTYHCTFRPDRPRDNLSCEESHWSNEQQPVFVFRSSDSDWDARLWLQRNDLHFCALHNLK